MPGPRPRKHPPPAPTIPLGIYAPARTADDCRCPIDVPAAPGEYLNVTHYKAGCSCPLACPGCPAPETGFWLWQDQGGYHRERRLPPALPQLPFMAPAAPDLAAPAPVPCPRCAELGFGNGRDPADPEPACHDCGKLIPHDSTRGFVLDNCHHAGEPPRRAGFIDTRHCPYAWYCRPCAGRRSVHPIVGAGLSCRCGCYRNGQRRDTGRHLTAGALPV